MSIKPIDDPNDPRLALFLNMRDRDIRRETPYFLAEGEHVVRRAFEAGLAVHQVLVIESKADRIKAMAVEHGAEGVEVLACTKQVMEQAAGFVLHQGIVAAVRVPEPPSLDAVCEATGRRTLAVCPEVTNVDNLGLLVRVGAALGVDAMVLGERSADTWYRRAVRVSMGAVFNLPIVRSDDIAVDLARMHEVWSYERVATVIDPSAQPLKNYKRDAERLAVLFGSEGYGLPEAIVQRCDHAVRIPMHHGIDSLNIAVAAGIVLHHVART